MAARAIRTSGRPPAMRDRLGGAFERRLAPCRHQVVGQDGQLSDQARKILRCSRPLCADRGSIGRNRDNSQRTELAFPSELELLLENVDHGSDILVCRCIHRT